MPAQRGRGVGPGLAEMIREVPAGGILVMVTYKRGASRMMHARDVGEAARFAEAAETGASAIESVMIFGRLG